MSKPRLKLVIVLVLLFSLITAGSAVPTSLKLFDSNLGMAGNRIENLGNVTLAGNMGLTGGNVGIGTSSPGSALDVVGRVTGRGTFYADTGTQQPLTLEANGGANVVLDKDGGETGLDFTVAHNTAGDGSFFREDLFQVKDNGQVEIPNNGNLNISGNLNVGFNTLHANKTSGNVGVGTDTPVHPLQVVHASQPGIVLEDLDSEADDKKVKLQVNGGVAKFLSLLDNDNSRVDNILTMDMGTGNVGIGTSNPVAALTVKGDSADVLIRDENDVNVASVSQNTAGEGTLFLYEGGSVKTRLHSNGVSYFTGGNVGIGTTGPDALLEVEQATAGTWGVHVDGGTVNRTAALLHVDNNNASTTAPLLRLHQEATPASDAYLFRVDTTSSNTDQFAVKGNGNVGIGTGSPGELLGLESSSSLALRLRNTNGGDWRFISRSTDDRLDISQGGTTHLTVNGSGSVGVGTTTPGFTGLHKSLTIDASDGSDGSRSALEIKGDVTGTAELGRISWINHAAGGNEVFGEIRLTKDSADANGTMQFLTLDDDTLSEAMRIDAEQDVGISEANPGTISNKGVGRSLHVTGSRPSLILDSTSTDGNVVFGESGAAKISLSWNTASNFLQMFVPGGTNFIEYRTGENAPRIPDAASTSGTAVVVDGNNQLHLSSSSKRFKSDIQSWDYNHKQVLDLEPVTFDRENYGADFGFIAERLLDNGLDHLVTWTNASNVNVPEGYEYEREGMVPQGIQYRKFTVHHNAILNDHENQISHLESENTEQTKKIEQLEEENRKLRELVCEDHPDADVCE